MTKNDKFIGGEQQYFESISDEEIFGVMVEIGSIDLKPTSGLPEKLNGYNYTPGSILAAGYDDTSTLAQTIANLYDLMSKGDHIANPKTNYDAKTGKYSFSYEYLAVNATSQHPSSGAGGEAVMDYQVYLYYVDVEFTVNDDMVINLCNFSVESYRNWEKDTDLVYYPETDTYELLETASPTIYTYEVSQTSGERTYTTIYPRASFMPIDFDLFFVTATDYNSAGQMYVKEETPIIDIDGDGIVDLTLDKETYTRLHIGGLIPSSAIPSFMNTEDFEVICENLDEGNGLLWGTDFFQDPTYSGYMDCIAFRTSANSGKYLVTIRFGQVTKQICITIPGTPTVVIPDDTADTKYVYVSSVNGWEDKYTFTANESGKYTFTLPVGLGFVFEGADTPEYDPFHPVYADQNEHTVEFTLAKGESVTFFVGAEEKGVFAIKVAFEASATPDPDPTPDTPTVAEKPLNENGSNAVNGANVAFTFTASSNGVLTIKYGGFVAMGGGESSGTVTYSINGGEAIDVVGGSVENKINLNKDDKIVITVISNCYATIISAWAGESTGDDDQIQGTGTEDDPYIITAGDYTAEYAGNGVFGFVYYSFTADKNGFITVTSKFDGDIWLNLGAESNEGEAQSLSAFVPAGSEIIITVADWDEQPDSIPFSVSFEEKASDSFDALVGTWYAKSEDIFTILYTLTINADGKGTFSYDTGYGATEYNVTYVFVDGENVTIGYGSGSLACTFDGTAFACQSGVMQDAFTFQTTPIEDDGGEGGDDPDEPTYEEDPVKESLLGTYTVGDYNVFIYNSYTSDGYIAEVYTDGYLVDLYFTFDVTDNGDGSYKLALTYLSRPDYEAGTDKVDEILALDIVITPSNEEEEKTPLEELDGTYLDNALNGYNVGLYYDVDALVYYLNVYGGADDLYYICQVTENADGSVTLVLDFDENHWQYWGAEKTDVYELNGKTVVATKNDGAWTFAVAEAPTEEPEVPVTGGTFYNPHDLDAENTLSYAGGMNYVWYAYTAGEAGTLTVTMTSEDFFWAYGMDEFALETMATNPSAEIALKAGDVLYIGVSTNSTKAAEVTFTSSFVPNGSGAVAEQGTFANPFDLEASNSCDYPGGMEYVYYKYTATEDGTLTITFVSSDRFWAYGANSSALNIMNTKETADIALKAGEVIYIGISTNTTSAKTVEFTSSFSIGDVEEEEKINQADLVIGNNSVEAADIKFNYTAESDIKLNVEFGTPINGAVTVTYSINGGEEVEIISGTNVDIELKANDTLVITAKTSAGYATITVREVVEVVGPNGTSSNPYIIESLPYDIVYTGKHDKNYKFTATEDIVLTITCPADCYVTNSAGATNEGGIYTIELKAGESVDLNVWTNNTTGDFTYTVKKAEPVVEEPNQGGDGDQGGESTGIDGTYIGAGNGRGMKIVIDTAADTIVFTRASSGSLTNFEGGTTYTLSYSELLGKASDGLVAGFISGTSIMNLKFNSDGTVSELTWNGTVYKDYVKQ